jgi:predicted RNase H-like nuclease
VQALLMNGNQTILAIDAAWTASQPSGVALVQQRGNGWRCIALAPSYESFMETVAATATDWAVRRFPGSEPDFSRLLEAAGELAGRSVDLVTLDMPVARSAFTTRREADRAVSREFSSRWCAAHSPTPTRPGPLGARISGALSAAGYALATTATISPGGRQFLEVYPHPAFLSLLRRAQRVPYKVSKSRKYWPGESVPGRIRNLLSEFSAIRGALAEVFDGLRLELPEPTTVKSLSALKRYEDGLDALVCGWMGVEYLAGRTVPLGNDDAAIWCPADVVRVRDQDQRTG